MTANLFGNFLTVAALPLLILLIIIYYSRKPFKTIRTKLYKMLVFGLLICCCSEIIKALLINGEAPLLVLEISSRMHFSLEALWWYLFELYTIAVFEKIQSYRFRDVVKYNKFTIALTIMYALFVIGTCTLPQISTVKEIDLNRIIYMPRIAYYACFLIMGTEFILAIYYIIKTRKDNEFSGDRYVMLTVNIGIVIFFVIQYIFPYISFPFIIFTVFLYLAYFLNENPEIELLKEINASKETIEKSSGTKTDFLSKLSYEIKVPMDLIVSLCDDINNTPEYNELEFKKNIGQIVQNGNDLLDIINNVLDLSKIETGKINLTETNYKLSDLMTNIINVSRKKLGSKPVQLVVNINQNSPSVLYGDYSKLYQSLLNVISNAIKYTDVGRIYIEVLSSRENNNEHFLFKIVDTGCGIKDEDKDKVFNNEDSEENNTGLGLTITKQYIEAMGGKIWFESEYRVGTYFYIDIVQKVVDPTPIENFINIDDENVKVRLDCSNYKALIVDDDLLNIKVEKRILENYKFQVDYLSSGKECIDKIKEDEKYDIIFLDHVMPDIDGIETLKALRSLEGYKLPPIIALTANAIVGMKEMYISEGFDDYLAKPINHHELDRIINKYLKSK